MHDLGRAGGLVRFVRGWPFSVFVGVGAALASGRRDHPF